MSIFMQESMPVAKKPKKRESFGVQQYLSNAGVSRSIAKFKKGQVIFSQDDPCDHVLYIQSGNAKLSIVNTQGKEAVLAIVGPGDFLGEGCIIGNPVRMATATAIAPLNAMSIEKKEMMRVLHDEQEFAGKFIAYMLEHNLTQSEILDKETSARAKQANHRSETETDKAQHG
jgi:CRP/FNR family transcriptional regulator, cyclic AMP receptor protein